MILRFIGDLSEPVQEEEQLKESAPTGLRKKVSTLGRKFLSNNNKLIAEAGGEGALEQDDDEQAQVCTPHISRGESIVCTCV